MGELLWICKDASSQSLSRSSRKTDAQIRHHVQAQGRQPLPNRERQIEEGSFGKIRFRVASPSKRDLESMHAFAHPSAAPPPLQHICRLPYHGLGLSISEHRSLAFFQEQTARQCSGYLDYEFWTSLVLRLAQHSRLIAHSLAALAALHESAISTEQCLTTFDQHRHTLLQLAYRQGEKATEAATSPSLTHLEALISCLVIFCSYGLGNATGIYRLLMSGHSMLEECGRSGSGVDNAIIEANIRPLFQRLDVRVCAICNIVASLKLSLHESHHQALTINGPPMPSFPNTFDGLQDARDSLVSIFAWWRDTTRTRVRVDDQPLSMHVDSLVTLWEQVLQSSQFDTSVQSSAELLLASALNGKILIAACNSESEMIYDEFTVDFNRILTLIHSAFTAPRIGNGAVSSNLCMRVRTTLGIDDGVIDILSLVGSKCRDPRVRRRALQMLREGGRVEGDRSAFVPGQIVEAIIEMEEQETKRTGRELETCKDVLECDRRVLVEGYRFATDRGNSAFQTGGRVKLLFRNALIQSSVEEYHVSLGTSETPVGETTVLPDAIFRAGYAAFLDDSEKGSYYEVRLDEFTFPMPRV